MTDVLRAAGKITGQKQFVIVGSQSLHGKCPDLPDEILASAEADLIAKGGCNANRVVERDWNLRERIRGDIANDFR